eukprot:109342-Prymnesium_polylepis.1
MNGSFNIRTRQGACFSIDTARAAIMHVFSGPRGHNKVAGPPSDARVQAPRGRSTWTVFFYDTCEDNTTLSCREEGGPPPKGAGAATL